MNGLVVIFQSVFRMRAKTAVIGVIGRKVCPFLISNPSSEPE